MFKIGEFSKLSRISIRMLRHYDEIGLLVPEHIDPWTGYRRYAAAQLLTASRITALRCLGFSLADTASLLACWEDRDAMERRLQARRAAVETSIRQASDQLRLLDTAIDRLRKEEAPMKYDVTIKTLPERQVASVRQILPGYDREGDLWHIFAQETASLRIQDGDPPLCVSVFHDGEYKESDVDVEIQKTVKGTYPDTAHVTFKTVPPVTVASATFQGGYHQIGEVNQAVAAWAEANGYAFGGPFFNIYHVSPRRPGIPMRSSPRCATRCRSDKQTGGAFQRRLLFYSVCHRYHPRQPRHSTPVKMPMPRKNRSRSVRYRAKDPTELNTNSTAATSPKTCPANA